MKHWYETLFENYGDKYEKEVFTGGTTGECDFIESEIGEDRSKRILDIGCGTGRHDIELARRGYNVTGIDLSDSMLRKAGANAAAAGVSVDFRKHDARGLPFSGEFELVIMICEGAFPLMETDEMNFRILGNAAKALKPGGKYIFTTLNGLFPLFHSVKEFMDSNSSAAEPAVKTLTFDLMTMREHSTIRIEDDFGDPKEIECDERYYLPSEISWMLKSIGFRRTDIFGARLGKFNRGDRLTPDDFEMLVVAEK